MINKGYNLIHKIFKSTRNHFFDATLSPVPFYLRPKINTQDDPLDEHINDQILSKLEDAKCERSGSLTSPDAVIYSNDAKELHPIQLDNNINKIVGLEIKKVGRDLDGSLSRLNTIDYNSTPPCGTILIYNEADEPTPIKCFYMFLCLERLKKKSLVSAVALVDGDLLNDDFDFYLSITGEREKTIGLGSYGDGMNRSRPMLVFPNPLSITGFDHNATLVCADETIKGFSKIAVIHRTKQNGATKTFNCYRVKEDILDETIIDLGDPFTIPKDRSIKTSQRGKFKISF